MKNLFLNGLQIHSSLQEIGFVVEDGHQGFDDPNRRTPMYDKPGANDDVVSNSWYGARQLQIPGRVSGLTIAQHRLNRRSLQNALRIIKDLNGQALPILMTFQTDDDLFLQAEVHGQDGQQAVQFINKSLNHSGFVLNLVAPDHRFYSQSQQNVTVNLPSSSGLVYPVIYPVTYPAAIGGQATVNNAGDENTPFVLTFYGPLTNPFIKNLTTGESFQVNLTLNSGDFLTIDMLNNTMVLNNISNALSAFVLSNVWMELIPGDNVIQFGSGMSSDSGYSILSFRSAYLGI